MNLGKINDWLQLVGTFGVLAGLVFVGLQLKQEQTIALADGFMTASQRQYQVVEVIGQAPEVWARGLSDQELTDAEQLYFGEMADAWSLTYFATWNRALLIGNREEQAERWVRETALDLYSHPGLLKWWRANRLRSEYTTGPEVDSDFDFLVDEELRRLQESGGITSEKREE